MRVRVAGWSNSRNVHVEDGEVYFEVGMDHNHCPTCASRVRHIKQALSQQDKQPRFVGGGGSQLYVVLDAPPQGESIQQYLGKVLDLNIN